MIYFFYKSSLCRSLRAWNKVSIACMHRRQRQNLQAVDQNLIFQLSNFTSGLLNFLHKQIPFALKTIHFPILFLPLHLIHLTCSTLGRLFELIKCYPDTNSFQLSFTEIRHHMSLHLALHKWLNNDALVCTLERINGMKKKEIS